MPRRSYKKKSRRRSYKKKSRSRKGSRKSRSRSKSRRRSRRGMAKGCGGLSMGACNDKFSNGLRSCRWSYSKLRCEGIPAKYRKRATLGVGGSATYRKYRAGARRKLSAARLSPFQHMKGYGGAARGPVGKLSKSRVAAFETKSEAVKAAQMTPTSSDVYVNPNAPDAPPLYYFFY